MVYFVKTSSGVELFKSETATTAKEAVQEAVKGSADLGGADLRGADLRRADLGGADLRGADLRDADLRDAYLRGADLGGADLRRADLGGQWIVQGATRSDGYQFFLQKLKDDSEPMIKAGCRHFTVDQAFAHWQETRANTPLGEETFSIINNLLELARTRKLIEVEA